MIKTCLQMKKGIFLLIVYVAVLAFCNRVSAQSLSAHMQAAYEACLRIRSSIGSGNLPGLRSAGKAFKACNTKDFGNLRCISRNVHSLDGHFVFDEVFIDSLVEGRKVYKFAQRYADRRRVRGTSGSGGLVFDKTCAVEGKSSVKYSLVSKGRQELAVITEPGGMITLRIYDKTHDRWFNDDKSVKKGMPSRYKIIDLPKNERSLLEIEIINTSDKNISFVILGSLIK